MNLSPRDRPVVVGVDGTALSHEALVFALEEGSVRNVPVVALMAWTFGTTLRDANAGDTYEQLAQQAAAQLEEIVAEALESCDAPPTVEQRAVHGDSGSALVDAARDAAMLVVGSGRKGPLARVLLGSTSEHCVRHCQSPVVVVPDPSCL